MNELDTTLELTPEVKFSLAAFNSGVDKLNEVELRDLATPSADLLCKNLYHQLRWQEVCRRRSQSAAYQKLIGHEWGITDGKE